MDQVRVTVGTNLSYPEETVTSGAPEDFLTVTTTGLHIMMLENPEAKYIITPGMNDETFVRGKVPMTKEEIRILSVAKLQLTEDAIVYDVGAGTLARYPRNAHGSVRQAVSMPLSGIRRASS